MTHYIREIKKNNINFIQGKPLFRL